MSKDKIRITGSVVIPRNQLEPDLAEFIRESLIFHNPFDGTEFKLFRSTHNYIVIPRGIPLLQRYRPSAILDVVDESVEFELTDGYALRDYQHKAEGQLLDILLPREYGEVLLRAKTGSGKTYMLSSVLQAIGKRVLILSHLTLLSDQMYEEMTTNTTANVKVLTANDVGKPLGDINICSFQLLAQNKTLVDYLRQHISVLVVDETENMVTDTRVLSILRLKFMYAIYMSATPTKELVDQTPAVRAITGPYEVVMERSAEYDVNVDVIIKRVHGYRWESPKNKNLYKKSYFTFLKKSGIIAFTTNETIELAQGSGTVWIIADLQVLQESLKESLENFGVPTAIINSKTTAKARKKILEGIASGLIKCLIGSAPLSAGLSIPQLKAAFRLMPHSSSEEVLEQQIGRLERFADFKQHESCLWYDFSADGSIDAGLYYREQFYRAQNRRIISI